MSTTPGSALLAGNSGAPDPAAGTPDPAAGGAPPSPAPAPAPSDAWYASLPAEYHGTITAKGWSGPEAVLQSYVNLEKVVGHEKAGNADRLLVLPKADAKPEELAAFWDKAGKIGVPETAEGYGFKAPEGLDAPILAEAAGWALKAGMPVPMANAFVEQAIAYEQAQVEAFQQRSTQEIGDLQQEWGAKFDDNAELGRRAVRAAGLDGEVLDKIELAIGTGAFMKMFHAFGKNIVEAAAPPPDAGGANGQQFSMSQAQAVDKAAALRKDSDFMARYLSPNPALRRAAMEEIEKLDRLASGG